VSLLRVEYTGWLRSVGRGCYRRILAMTSRGCHAENGPVEFKLYRTCSLMRQRAHVTSTNQQCGGRVAVEARSRWGNRNALRAADWLGALSLLHDPIHQWPTGAINATRSAAHCGLRPQCAVNLDRNSKLAIMRQCTSVTDRRTDRRTPTS